MNAVTLFCEDVREEKAGLDTLIGVFFDNLNVPLDDGPADRAIVLPKLGMYTRVILEIDESVESVRLFLQWPNGTQVQIGETFTPETIEQARREALANGAPTFGLVFRAVTSPFRLGEGGHHKAIVKIGDKEVISGILNIRFVTPIASAQPS